ncbi:Zinc ABC transporter, periplasmic-binding protein ZnuA [hydrothermal vent metagenome]|uniref:Zinc ABC transporter, periplasmic-binding protein ZnuA n=1 Tax=hydrothermal vent metagenome TaxID=652676 RepID=A0A3B1EA82_9ZZZZ
MNKLILLLLFGFLNILYAKLNIIVSILPQKTFVKAIGGDKVDVHIMVQPGSSPHTYEPKPSDMKAIEKANLYFTIGVEFENSWINKFKNQNNNMQIKNISTMIDKNNDPHIWTSPANVKIISQNICTYLSNIDKKNKIFYKNNLNKFLKHVENTDKQVRQNLKNLPVNSKFMVFHPAWGHFASYYNLKQISIEIDGKEPKPKTLLRILKEAKKHKVKAIFTQLEFSAKMAKIIANELNIKVIKISPLSPNWSENIINFSKALCPS